MVFKVDYVREQFPCLSKTVNGVRLHFLTGPAEHRCREELWIR